MKTLHVTLNLSTTLHGRHRDRCPSLVFTLSGDELAAIRSDVAEPRLPLDDNSIDRIVISDDALSRVLDEEAWLIELSRTLTINGVLSCTLPADGVLAWLDALTIYRYIADVTGRGDDPDSTRPTGWNRHYSPREINRLLATAGLEPHKLTKANHAVQEIAMLAALVWNNWVKRDRHAEITAWKTFGRRDPGESTILPLGTTWVITAIKRGEPEDVDADPHAESIDPTADPSE